jgi:hypothetical protein
MTTNPMTHDQHAAKAEAILNGYDNLTDVVRALAHTQLALYRQSVDAMELGRVLAERAARQQDDIAALMASDPSRI